VQVTSTVTVVPLTRVPLVVTVRSRQVIPASSRAVAAVVRASSAAAGGVEGGGAGGLVGGVLDLEAGAGQPSAVDQEPQQQEQHRGQQDEFDRRRPALVRGRCHGAA